jgi:predicted metal-dependent peptidase
MKASITTKSILNASLSEFELEHAIVENLKKQLYSRLRFLALPLGMMKVSFSADVDRIATDGETLRFHTEWLRRTFQTGSDELILTILHSLYHCLLGHLWQGKKKRPDIWDYACDIMVWRLAGETYGEYLPAEYTARTGEAADLAGGCMTAEKLYTLLEDSGLPVQDTFYMDDHRGWDQVREKEETRRLLEFFGPGQGGSGAEGLLKKWRRLEESSLGMYQGRRRQDNGGEGNSRRRLNLGEAKRIGYADFLKRFATVRETAELNDDEFQYSYYYYGLSRYNNMPIIEALEYRERLGLEELGIVIDTSGSCSRDLSGVFLEETRNILLTEHLFFRRFNLHIIQCDNQVRRDDRITSVDELSAYIRDLEIAGQGGTDFRPAFAYINALRKEGAWSRLKGILYFTDGQGIYPAEMPEYETAFIFVKDRYEDIDVPVWAHKLVLDTRPAVSSIDSSRSISYSIIAGLSGKGIR